MMVILLAHSGSNSRLLSMSVLQVVIAAISSVDVPNDVKFANSLKSFNQMLHLHGICVCLLGSSVVVNFPLDWGWVRKLKTSLYNATPG